MANNKYSKQPRPNTKAAAKGKKMGTSKKKGK